MFNTVMSKQEIQDRFNGKYVIDAGGCWIWTGTRANKVTPQMTLRNAQRTSRPAPAKRISYWLAYGDFDPDTHIVTSTCNNPLCVNPAHLYLVHGPSVSVARNTNTVSKELHARGITHGMHKLTEEEVREIRADKTSTLEALSQRYGVGPVQIWLIRRRKAWKHIK